jgi:hypothetical protein
MKESITKFDLEAAFKALDEIDVPVVDDGVRANRPALTEIFSRKTKLDTLLEDYYDINDMSDLNAAKDDRAAEVAQAKLARIEKIVDLDAETPEDLLPSYVGKFIMQCPQCMTLFYKNPDDIEASEDDPETVNVNEVCQHCGNDSGYTLIGKVGAATEEEQDDMRGVQEVDVDSTTDDADTGSEGGDVNDTYDDSQESEIAESDESDESEEFDLDLIEDEEEYEEDAPEKQEEEYYFGARGDIKLFEDLQEDMSLDVSDAEFETLLNSSELKTPISDTEVRAMLADMSDENADADVKEAFSASKKKLNTKCANTQEDNKTITENFYDDFYDDVLTDHIDDVLYSGKFLHAIWVPNAPSVKRLSQDTYRVTHHKGGASVTVKFDLSNKKDPTMRFTVNGKPFTTKSMTEAQDFIIAELQTAYVKQFDVDLDESTETLVEGNILDLGKAIGKSLVHTSKKIKNALSTAIDNYTDKVKTREEKADWILLSARKDYRDIQDDAAENQIVPDETERRFSTFAVIGFKDRYSNGRPVTVAPDYNNNALVVGMEKPELFEKYVDADKCAKGWSIRNGNGPAFIYFANDSADTKAVFLCEYFKGDLKNDKLEKYFETVKKDLKGAALMVDSQQNKTIENSTPEEQTDNTAGTASTQKPAADAANSGTNATQTTAQGGESNGNTANAELVGAGAGATKEHLITVVNGLEALSEAVLEKLITRSLVESYSNITGFKLEECLDFENSLAITGTIKFDSGKTRKTTYTFTEAITTEEGKTKLYGFNEKLGIAKHFAITGHVDASSKTFIAESFDRIAR